MGRTAHKTHEEPRTPHTPPAHVTPALRRPAQYSLQLGYQPLPLVWPLTKPVRGGGRRGGGAVGLEGRQPHTVDTQGQALAHRNVHYVVLCACPNCPCQLVASLKRAASSLRGHATMRRSGWHSGNRVLWQDCSPSLLCYHPLMPRFQCSKPPTSKIDKSQATASQVHGLIMVAVAGNSLQIGLHWNHTGYASRCPTTSVNSSLRSAIPPKIRNGASE